MEREAIWEFDILKHYHINYMPYRY